MIAERITALRTKAHLAQDELGKMLDVSPETISEWESGDSLPDTEQLENLAFIFGVSVTSLVEEANAPRTENIVPETKCTQPHSDRKTKKRIYLILAAVLLSVAFAFIYLGYEKSSREKTMASDIKSNTRPASSSTQKIGWRTAYLLGTGSYREIEDAIKRGMDVNGRFDYGMTALMIAAYENTDPKVILF